MSPTAYPRTKRRVEIKTIAGIVNRFRIAARVHCIEILCVQIILIVVEIYVQSERYIPQATGPRRGTRTQQHRIAIGTENKHKGKILGKVRRKHKASVVSGRNQITM